MSEIVAYKIEFFGRVQQVGFRIFCWELATRFEIYGTVRNRRDGAVEVICEGPEANIEKFIKACEKGNSWSHVDKITRSSSEIQSFNKFKIIG